ncbi:class I SAM-dependent methyltransferase [Aeromonas hydrophila]|uniref:class I SAM-dependent methyltransferase n=1 Tax=Aeromonas hydrophila TaxID=644 RepID=UPI0009B9024D|nr:class I SAM-dependent methyltransferase [Aeromonas hydrophila]
MNKETANSTNIYTSLTLKFHDWWTLSVPNHFAWQCSTSKVLVPYFKNNSGLRHLDVGVGTGFYLQHLPPESEVLLMDVNQKSLTVAKQRVGKLHHTTTIKHDIFSPLPQQHEEQFDSVSLYYLLHCLPGSLAEKTIALRNASTALKPQGTLFGATILGNGVSHNFFGKKLMSIYNSKGIFSNKQDTEADLRHALKGIFKSVEIINVGKVALFAASGKINGGGRHSTCGQSRLLPPKFINEQAVWH